MLPPTIRSEHGSRKVCGAVHDVARHRAMLPSAQGSLEAPGMGARTQAGVVYGCGAWMS